MRWLILILFLPSTAFATVYQYDVLPVSDGYFQIYEGGTRFQSKNLDGEISFTVDDATESIVVDLNFDQVTVGAERDPLFPLDGIVAHLVWKYGEFEPGTGALDLIEAGGRTNIELTGAPFETLEIHNFFYRQTMPVFNGSYLFDFAWGGNRGDDIYELGATTRLLYRGEHMPEPMTAALLLAGLPIALRRRAFK